MILEPSALVYLCGFFFVEFQWIFIIQLQGFRSFSGQRPYAVILDEPARAYRIYSGKAHNFFQSVARFHNYPPHILPKRDGSSQRRQGISGFHAVWVLFKNAEKRACISSPRRLLVILSHELFLRKR